MKPVALPQWKLSGSGQTPPADLLASEQRAFQRQRRQLLRRYPGQYVALQGGRVVAHGRDDEALAARMFERVGDATFLIVRVEETPSAFEVPSPELPR
jgi:hypothetical protein